MAAPLEGVRILAIEQYGAGPFGTQHLADFGAEVIKIENRRTGGDYARSIGPYFVDSAEGDEGSLFFQSINRNKHSLSLDLAHPDGQKVFNRLVANADAVANNMRGDVPEKLGLTYDSLSGVNPAIVCAHCSAYGRTGPRKDWPGYDFLMQAEAGYFHMCGEPDTPPTRMGLSVVDFMAGTYLALGLLAGIISARASGQGRDVDVNLADTAMFNLSYLSAWALNSDYDPKRVSRSAHATVVPCQLYKTADGWLYVMCNKEKFWLQLCKILQRPDLADSDRYCNFASRLQHREELTEILDAAFKTDTTENWLVALGGTVPAAAVNTPRQAVDNPTLREAGKVQRMELGKGGFDLLANPILTGDKPQGNPCPPLGSDTRRILLEVGYSAEQIDELEKNEVI